MRCDRVGGVENRACPGPTMSRCVPRDHSGKPAATWQAAMFFALGYALFSLVEMTSGRAATIYEVVRSDSEGRVIYVPRYIPDEIAESLIQIPTPPRKTSTRKSTSSTNRAPAKSTASGKVRVQSVAKPAEAKPAAATDVSAEPETTATTGQPSRKPAEPAPAIQSSPPLRGPPARRIIDPDRPADAEGAR